MSCAISLFQWRTNGANRLCAIIKGAIGKTNDAFKCAIVFSKGAPMAQWRTGGGREQISIQAASGTGRLT